MKCDLETAISVKLNELEFNLIKGKLLKQNSLELEVGVVITD